jgi:predicted RNase H-like HicB family nuclease
VAGEKPQFPLNVEFDESGDSCVVATIPGIPGASARGRTREEARDNVMEALRGILEARRTAAE